MSKNIIVIGSVDHSTLAAAMADLAHASDHAATKMQTLAQSLEDAKSTPITNPYQDLRMIYDPSMRKSKRKKSYWRNGKRKYK